MMFERGVHDLWLACRGLRRAKGFASAAILTLAVGMAGITTMFSLVEGVLLRPLPVHDEDRVVVGWKALRSAGLAHAPFRASEIDVLRGASRLLETVGAVSYYGSLRLVAVEGGSASYVNGAPVTGDFFRVLGLHPRLGRLLTAADDLAGAERVAVISDRFWQQRYGGSTDVIDRRLLLSERSFTIVGVTPPDVGFPAGTDVWLALTPFAASAADSTFQGDVARDVDLIARMRPGVSIEQLTGELQTLMPRFDRDAPPGALRGLSAEVRPLKQAIVGDLRRSMLVLFGAMGLVLLIATANAANLLLLRTEARRSEVALRVALGAGRVSLARQLMAECAALTAAAALLGLTVTWAALRTLVAVVPEGLPRLDAVRVDAGVLLFTCAVAFVTVALAGMVPTLAIARLDLVQSLRNGVHGSTSRTKRHGRRALVVAQLAFAIVIVAAAGLLVRSFSKLQSVDTGVAADRLVFAPLSFPGTKYAGRERHQQFVEEVMAQLEAAPEVISVTPVNVLPFSGTHGWELPEFTAEGQSADRVARNPSLNLEAIHPNYFDTFQIGLVRGRPFSRADREDAPKVAIVSEDVAARLWPGEDPVGRRLKFGRLDNGSPWRTIVGVARPTRYRELREARPTLYLPAAQFLETAATLVLRTASPQAVVAGVVRDRVRAVDPAVQVMGVTPFDTLLEEPLARPRFNAYVIGIFGVAALLLAAVGVYAVMAASVRQRYTEIGIRLALGAGTSDVRRLVLGEGLRLAGLGAAIGFAIAVTGARLLRGLLFGVRPLDPATMLATAILVLGAAAFVSDLPARRAMRVNPVDLLHAD